MPLKPICFVVAPQLDTLYETAILPAIEEAGFIAKRFEMSPTRGWEDLLLCDFVVAELTGASPELYYVLGIRHAVRPNTTVRIDTAGDADQLRRSLAERLREISGGAADSTVLQLVRSTQGSNLPAATQLGRIQRSDTALFELLNHYSDHDKTDIFRDAVEYSDLWREALEAARKAGDRAKLDAIRDGLRPLDGVQAGVVIDLYLSYRAVGAMDSMLALYDEMPEVLKRSVLVEEQRAFALNRLAGKAKRPEYRDEAIRILEDLWKRVGPSSETGGLLGRIYKDLWTETGSAEFLRKAIDAYSAGFEADSRDAFPGINAVTLLDVAGSPEDLAKKDQMLPVVRYAVELRLKGSPDYWDYATLLEIGVLEGNEAAALGRLEDALALVREKWEPETTARNLKLIREAREERGQSPEWAKGIEEALMKRAGG